MSSVQCRFEIWLVPGLQQAGQILFVAFDEVTESRVHASRKRCTFSCRLNDVWIAQLDGKTVPQTKSSGCKSSVAVTAVFAAQCKSNRQLTALPQRAPSVVGHEAATIYQVERRLPRERLANQTCHFELDTLSNGCMTSG